MQTPYNRIAPVGGISPSADVMGEHSTVLVSFGAGSEFRVAISQLEQEARSVEWFDRVVCLADTDQSAIIKRLFEVHGDFISKNKKGFGYWVWKSFILNEIAEGLNDGDVLVYLDAGCEISPLGRLRWLQYMTACREGGALFFSIPFIEREWTKQSCLTELHATTEQILTKQIQATWFMLRIDSKSRSFLREWHEMCCTDNYALLRDAPDGRGNGVLVSHRHDQSVLSILVKRYRFPIIEWEDRYAAWLYCKNSWVYLSPVHATRSRKRRRVFHHASSSNVACCLENKNHPSVFFFLQTHALKAREFAKLWLKKIIRR